MREENVFFVRFFSIIIAINLIGVSVGYWAGIPNGTAFAITFVISAITGFILIFFNIKKQFKEIDSQN